MDTAAGNEGGERDGAARARASAETAGCTPDVGSGMSGMTAAESNDGTETASSEAEGIVVLTTVAAPDVGWKVVRGDG